MMYRPGDPRFQGKAQQESRYGAGDAAASPPALTRALSPIPPPRKPAQEPVWFYIDQSRARIGPVSVPDLTALLTRGQISGETYGCHAEGREWQFLSQIPELSALFAHPIAPPRKEKLWFYLDEIRERQGPIPEKQFRDMIARGQVESDCYCCQSDGTEWLVLANVRIFQAELAQAAEAKKPPEPVTRATSPVRGPAKPKQSTKAAPDLSGSDDDEEDGDTVNLSDDEGLPAVPPGDEDAFAVPSAAELKQLPVLPPDGSGGSQCCDENCVAFATINNSCYRHYWKTRHLVWQPSNALQHKIAMELFETEKTYYEAIYGASHRFYNGLRCAGLVMGKPIIPDDVLETIFGNLPTLTSISKSLVKDLEELVAERCLVAQVHFTLLHWAPKFRVYCSYMEGYDKAIKCLQQARSTIPAFDTFLKWNEKREGADLASLLIQPIQRLPRYLLLLKELAKSAPANAPAKAEIELAMDAIKNVTGDLNSGLEAKEHEQKIEELVGMFEKGARYRDLRAPGRQLIRKGPLIKSFSRDSKQFKQGKRYLFILFNDALTYAQQNGRRLQMKHWMPLTELTCSRDDKVRRLLLSCKSGSKGETSFTVKADTVEEATAWFNDLQKWIDKSQPRQLESSATASGQASKIAKLMGGGH